MARLASFARLEVRFAVGGDLNLKKDLKIDLK